MEYYVSCERRSTYVYLDVTAVPYIVTCSRNRDDGRIYAGISTNMHTAIAIPRIAKIYARNTKQQSANRVGSVCTASVPVNAVTKFLTSTDGAKLEKSTFILERPEFPYIHRADWSENASMAKTARSVYMRFDRIPTCDRRADGHRAIAIVPRWHRVAR